MPKARKKPKWGKPKLIVLVKSKPEENVLQSCKDGGELFGPLHSYKGCYGDAMGQSECSMWTPS